MTNILSDVLVNIANEKIRQENGYGISIINLPEIDFKYFVCSLDDTANIEIYFLGYGKEKEEELKETIACTEGIALYFTVEEAEKSRNKGLEGVFRIHFIKSSELEKISSLKWYETIDVDLVYKYSCEYVKKSLVGNNETIKELLRALARKDIRELLNFERVLEYLNCLLEANSEDLPAVVEKQIYRLGLLMDSGFCTGNPGLARIKGSIKHNYDVVRRISTLEKKDRQNIATYSARHPDDGTVRLILEYYNTPSLRLLKKMELKDVEACLKAASKTNQHKKSKKLGRTPVSIASEIMFEEKDELIDKFIEKAIKRIDNRNDKNKATSVPIEVNGTQIDFPISPATEKLAEISVDENKWGKYIYADVGNPQEAIEDSDKYNEKNFDEDYIKEIMIYLGRAREFPETKDSAEGIEKALNEFLQIRKLILPYALRLQDMPMLQVLQRNKEFVSYLESYERLIFMLKDGYTSLYELDSLGAKQVISSIVSLDFVYIIGQENSHAMPTPLNPLYLWKYIKLAQEILEARGVSEENECYLSDADKDFITRKAEEIPDPLALVMLPKNSETAIESLPYAGRIGNIPVYSSTPQISDSKVGMDVVCQNIVRYMCLYPHSSMMLHISFINPPSVEQVVAMLKNLDRNKDFSSFEQVGIDLTIYRTKETSSNWIEIQDKTLNEGMIGKIKGKNSDRFYLSVKNKCMTYSEIINDISNEQHLIIIFDPNERIIEIAKNSRNIHIHPLCVPKIYEYNKMRGDVRVRPANEGGVFSNYATIVEKLYEQPSTFGHRNVFVNTPLRKETYEQLLKKTDWLIVLDQNLKSWDISLRSISEKLFFKNEDYRSIGVYSKNSNKFILGYKEIISGLGNFTSNDLGVSALVSETRAINDDGLLSIVSHKSNQIFDRNHGKGSLGLALVAIKYKAQNKDTILIGLDTQLAQQWLAERDDKKLPDLIGITFDDRDMSRVNVDLIEVKTYDDYVINENQIISGHAVKQASILEELIREMFGRNERITTVSRREILREQIFEYVFASDEKRVEDKQSLCDRLNDLFAGEYSVEIKRRIYRVNFEDQEGFEERLFRDSTGKEYLLTVMAADEIQSIITGKYFLVESKDLVSMGEIDYEEGVKASENSDLNLSDLEKKNLEQEKSSLYTAKLNRSEHEKGEPLDINKKKVEVLELDEHEICEKCVRLNVVLKSYGIHVKPVDEKLVQCTNRFTRFKLEMMPGEIEANLTKRKDDIARELEAAGEIFITRIPGTRYIAVDVPFLGERKALLLNDYLMNLRGRSGALNFVAGQEPDGNIKIVDLETAPHMLVAGTTGSGKSVFLNSVIVGLASTHNVDELELILIDPKQTEFYFYDGLPHLRNGKIFTDPQQAIEMLEYVRTVDIPERISKLQSSKSKTILQHNAKCPEDKLNYLVIIIDEYSVLVTVAGLKGKKVRDEFEKNLCTLVFMARAYGIHLIIATQYPTASYVTTALKSNLPFRVSFRLPSHMDSMTILDRTGAEDLLGNGDMLMLSDEGITRLQGCYVSEEDIEQMVKKRRENLNI